MVTTELEKKMAARLLPRLNVVNLGRCVIERDGKVFLVMYPDGVIRAYAKYATAIGRIEKYFSDQTPADSISIGEIVSYDGSINTVTSKNGYATVS